LAVPCLKSTMDRGRAPTSKVLRDVPYRPGVDTCTLDLHLPEGTKLETSSSGEPVLGGGKRVIVFVNGFAFRQGNNSMYYGIGQKLANEFGAIVAIPNVRGHPVAAEVNDMVDDVGACLSALVGMGAGKMEVIAHSSGASLVVIGSMRAARHDSSANGKKAPVGWQYVDGFKHVKCGVMLAGVFDVGLHYRHEWRRGVEGVSCLGCVHEVSAGGHIPRALCSVQSAEDVPSDLLKSVPPLLLLHGDSDDVVPETHSDRLWRALRGAESKRCFYHLLPGMDHYFICFDIAVSAQSSIVKEIRNFFSDQK